MYVWSSPAGQPIIGGGLTGGANQDAREKSPEKGYNTREIYTRPYR